MTMVHMYMDLVELYKPLGMDSMANCTRTELNNVNIFKVMNAFRECLHLLLVQWPHIELMLSVEMILLCMLV